MKTSRRFGIWLFVAALFSMLLQPAAGEVKLDGESSFHFADRNEAAQILGTRDAFVKALGPFDRSVRLKTKGAASAEELLEFMSDQARSFNAQEKERLTTRIESIRAKLKKVDVNVPFPEQIVLVKASQRLEHGLAHCRGSAIILPDTRSALKSSRLEHLLAHELFHILTTAHPELQRELYTVVGFRPCPGVSFLGELKPRKITNPDAFGLNYCAKLEYKDSPVYACPVLLSHTSTYEPSRNPGLMSYANLKFLVVERNGDSWACRREDGSPMVLDRSEVSGYLDKVGRNTGYIIHPEEVLAENFAFIVGGRQSFRTPEIPEQMKEVLRGYSEDGASEGKKAATTAIESGAQRTRPNFSSAAVGR